MTVRAWIGVTMLLGTPGYGHHGLCLLLSWQFTPEL